MYSSAGQFDVKAADRTVALLTQLLRVRERALIAGLYFPDFAKLSPEGSAAAVNVARAIEDALDDLVLPPDTYFREKPDRFVIVFLEDAPEAARKMVQAVEARVARRLAQACGLTAFPCVADITSTTFANWARGPGVLSPAAAGPCAADATAADAPESGPVAAEEGPIEICYRPIWDAWRKTTSNYFVTLMRTNGDRSVDYGYDVLSSRMDKSRLAAVDRQLLRVAIREVERALIVGDRFALTAPLHLPCLEDPALAKDYMELLQRIHPRIAKRLYLEITGFRSGSFDLETLAALARVYPYKDRFFLHLPIDGRAPDFGDGFGIAAVGVSGSSVGAGVATIQENLRRFVALAGKLGSPLYVGDVHTPDLVRLGAEIGVEYYAGAFFGDALAKPAPEHRMRLRTLYANYVAKTASAAG